jgi:hypothetical protein
MRWLLLLLLCLPAFAQTRPPVVVESLNQLLTRKPLADGEEADVKFGYQTNDWGGTRRIVYSATSAATTNIGDTFASGNTNVPGRWIAKDKQESRKDPRWWRAIPNDGIDDTAQLQALLDSGTRAIELPPGAFNLSGSGLTMSTPQYIVGSQRGASIFDYSGTGDALSISSGSTDSQVIGPRVEEVTFFGRTTGGSAPRSLLRVQGATRGTILRCSFSWDRDLGYPLDGSRNIWLNEQVWIWSITDCQIGYADVGILMTSTNLTKSSVNSISISGGEIFGNRYGILGGKTNEPSIVISGTHLLSNLWIKDVAIEANGAYGVWLNGAEQVTLDSIYTEANGHLYHDGIKYFTNELRSADLVLGNQFDVSTNFACNNVVARGMRFADSTNAVILNSGEFIHLQDNVWSGARGTNIIVSPNIRNSKLTFNSRSLSQISRYPTIHDPARVLWTERMGTANDPAVGGNSSYPFVSSSANLRLGDDDVIDGYTQNRIFDLSRYGLVQTRQPDEAVGFVAGKFIQSGGSNWYPRIGFWTDGTNGHVSTKSELSGATMPLIMDVNGTALFTMTASNNFLPNKVGIALGYSTNPHTALDTSAALTVGGGLSIVDTPHYYGANWRNAYNLGFAVTNSAATMGLTMLYRDIDAKQFFLSYNPASNVVNMGTAHPNTVQTNADTPIKIRNPHITTASMRFDKDGVWLGDADTNLVTAIAGKAALAHNHDASNITSGTLSTARLPVINIAASNITSGVIAPARLGSGSGSTNTWLNGQGAFTTIPTPPSPTNGITDAPADSLTYARLMNAWKALSVSDVGGLQTELDNRQTYDSMTLDGVVAGGLTSIAGLTVYDVPLVSPGVDYTPLVQDASGFGIKRMTTNDFLTQLGASPVGHVHTEAEVTGLITDLAKAITNIVGGAGTTVGITGQVATVSASSIYSPLAFAVAVPTTVGELNKTETPILGAARAGESKTLPAGYLTTGSILKIELIGTFTTALENWDGGRLKVKVGGLTLQFDPIDAGTSTPAGWTWTATCYVAVQAAGTSATVSATGYAMFPDNFIFGSAFTPQHIDPNVSGTLNTVGTNAVDVTWQNRDADMGLTITLKTAVVTKF